MKPVDTTESVVGEEDPGTERVVWVEITGADGAKEIVVVSEAWIDRLSNRGVLEWPEPQEPHSP